MLPLLVSLDRDDDDATEDARQRDSRLDRERKQLEQRGRVLLRPLSRRRLATRDPSACRRVTTRCIKRKKDV